YCLYHVSSFILNVNLIKLFQGIYHLLLHVRVTSDDGASKEVLFTTGKVSDLPTSFANNKCSGSHIPGIEPRFVKTFAPAAGYVSQVCRCTPRPPESVSVLHKVLHGSHE